MRKEEAIVTEDPLHLLRNAGTTCWVKSLSDRPEGNRIPYYGPQGIGQVQKLTIVSMAAKSFTD